MNLISQIFLIILIACFTGTVSLGFWRVFQPLLLKYSPEPQTGICDFAVCMYDVHSTVWLSDRQADLAWISADGKHMET